MRNDTAPYVNMKSEGLACSLAEACAISILAE
jgi:hypothetical protein